MFTVRQLSATSWPDAMHHFKDESDVVREFNKKHTVAGFVTETSSI